MSYIRKILRGEQPILKGDKVLWGIFITLLIISFLEVSSAAIMEGYRAASIFQPMRKHGLILLGSFVCAVICSHIPWSMIKRLAFPGYMLVLLLIVLTMMFGTNENNAQRTLRLGFLTLQPSEFLKPAMVFVAASLFRNPQALSKNMALVLYMVLLFIPWVPITLQSGSTGVILLLTSWVLLFVCNPPPKLFRNLTIIAVAFGVLSFVLLMTLPKETLSKVGRAATWSSRLKGHDTEGLSEEEYNKLSAAQKDSLYYSLDFGGSYQRKHSQIAISRGASSIFGVLPGNSKARDYLPEAHNDFIYSIIIEELGPIFGVLLVPALFITLFFRLGSWGMRTKVRYKQLILYGIGILYTLQALLNLGVAADVLPLTGQTLPLVSSGGSSLLATSISMGLVFAITASINTKKKTNIEKEEPEDAVKLPGALAALNAQEPANEQSEK